MEAQQRKKERLQAIQAEQKKRLERLEAGQEEEEEESGIGQGAGQSTTDMAHLLPGPLDTSMLDSEVAEVAAGSQHTAILTVAGTVFTMGRNLEGQLGVNTTELKLDLHPTVQVGGRTAQPGLVPVTRLADHRLVALAAGADFTLALAGNTLFRFLRLYCESY